MKVLNNLKTKKTGLLSGMLLKDTEPDKNRSQ
jgi:hypothetical protein